MPKDRNIFVYETKTKIFTYGNRSDRSVVRYKLEQDTSGNFGIISAVSRSNDNRNAMIY